MTTRFEREFLSDPSYGTSEPSTQKPGYTYPENYTGFSATVPIWDPNKGTSQSAGAGEGVSSPSRWTVPSKLTSQTSTTTGTTTPIKPSGPLPTFQLPKRDEGRIKELRREAMSTPMRATRQEARRALSRIGSMDSPMAKEAFRGWTEGLGTGISSIASSASMTAEKLYGVERAEEIRGMLTNFQAQMNDYLAQYGQKSTQTTTTQMQYGGEQGGGGNNDQYVSRNMWGGGMYYVTPPSGKPSWWKE